MLKKKLVELKKIKMSQNGKEIEKKLLIVVEKRHAA